MNIKELVKGKKETLGAGTSCVDVFQVFFFKSYSINSINNKTIIGMDGTKEKGYFDPATIYLF